jgi:hypothetical protein
VKFVFSLLVLAMVLLSCAAANPLPGTPECDTHRSFIIFKVDPAFTSEERAQLVAATDDWRQWSNGRINHVLEFEPASESSPRIRRLLSTSDEVREYEETQKARYKVDNFTVLGWQPDPPPVVNLVVDRVSVSELRNLAAHELGHAAGLEWPFCANEPRAPMLGKTDEKDCKHVADTHSLMSQAFANVPLQPADLEFCRASCLCD